MNSAAPERPPVRAGTGVVISGLTVRFGQLRALDSVDLRIEPGQIVALAGENGAGKSTLVRCIAGDIAPTAGQILLAGRPAPAKPLAAARQARQDVAVVWQDLSLCDNLSVAENLLLGRERRRHLWSDVRLHTEAAALLASLGIRLPDTTQCVQTLSGGERQLLAIARAMSREPRLLLLDEPTASLGVRYATQVEELIATARASGTTIVIACHDIEMMLRLADRIVVLRHGKVAGDVESLTAHPEDIVALISGQEPDSSARRQLTRLHGLTGRLVSADPSSSLHLIMSALGAALRCERLCIHLAGDRELICAASLGLPDGLRDALARLPRGAAGGPPGVAAVTEKPVIVGDISSGPAVAPLAGLASRAGAGSCWSVPVLAPGGLSGVITVLPETAGGPDRDQLELVTLYAGYAASAIERERLLDEVTARNQVLETIREVLETLAGPVPVRHALDQALRALMLGLQADQLALFTGSAEGVLHCRAQAGGGDHSGQAASAEPHALAAAGQALRDARGQGAARRLRGDHDGSHLAVTFAAPAGPGVLVACWRHGGPAPQASMLLEDAAHSLRLALEREEAAAAHQEATALRRSQELQREFLSRLSHELRTPLTAIRGYASSLLQPDVTWDAPSQRRFLQRVATESARLGRLVDDLLDFSAIELGILRLQPDWCDITLVLEAAAACLPPDQAHQVKIDCASGLPAVWADHDRLEQVFVNLLANAVGHNPPDTAVRVHAAADGPDWVLITVADEGVGLPPEIAGAPFEPARRRLSRTAGAGIGLSIASGIVAAHHGSIELSPGAPGTCFVIRLPAEDDMRQPVPDDRAEPAASLSGGSPARLPKDVITRG